MKPRTQITLPTVPRKAEIPTRTQYENAVIKEAEEKPEGFFTATYKISGGKYDTHRAKTLEEAKLIAATLTPPEGRHVMVYAVSGMKQVYVGSHIPGQGWKERIP